MVINGDKQVISGLTANDFVFSKDGHPAQLTEAGTYDVELSGDAINKIRQEYPNYNISFSSTATFILENSSQTINYVDADNKVISSIVIDGHIKGTKLPFKPEIPAGWVASDPSKLPTEITLNNGITSIAIKKQTTPQPPIPQSADQLVKFVDSEGNVIDSKTYTGAYDSTVSADLKIPAGYKLAECESLPTTITILNGVTIINIVKDNGDNKPDNKPDDHPHIKPDDNNDKPNNKPAVPDKPHTDNHGHLVAPDGKIFPKGSHIAANGDVIGPNGRILYHAGMLTRIGERVVKKHLPQTGAASDNPVVAGLAILGAS